MENEETNVDVAAMGERRPRLAIDSFEEFVAHEREILERIESVPNGGHLFLLHPFLLLAEVGVEITERAHLEIVRIKPELSALSKVPYEALKKSKEKQKIRFRIRSLSHRREP
jgi:hypothetical protein